MLSRSSLYQEDLLEIVHADLAWEKLAGRSILITGARGMIGSVLVDALVLRNELFGDGISIYALGRNDRLAHARFADYIETSRIVFLKHDVTKPLPPIGEIDYIVHAASNTHPRAYVSDPIGTITANVFGVYNLLSYAVDHSTRRFMFLSSVEVYGENRGDTELFDESYCGYIESHTLRAGYPESKRLGEALCKAFAEAHGVETAVLRLARVYGPTMSQEDSKAIAQFMTNAVSGKDVILKSLGNQMYSFCYVVDAVIAVLAVLLNEESGEAYNVAGLESDVTLRCLAERIARLGGVTVKYELPDEHESKGYSRATKALLCTSKLRALGWQPRYTLDEGLRRTFEIMRTLAMTSS